MKPLQGVRIVSVEQFGAAPYGTMLLADLGAEVIKIENAAIGGDPARKTGPYFLGANDSEYYQAFNINKKSVAIDLRSAEGKAALNKLIKTADALVNNLRGDLPAKMGLDYRTLASVNPKLVCVHVSAYGRDNERASWPGYDYLMQAESGLMHLTGDPDRPPSRLGAPSIIDQTTGLTAAVGLLSAVIQARSTGKGCDVDTCLLDVALASARLCRDLVSQRGPHLDAAAAQRALFGGAGADLSDLGRLGLHHVHDGQVLGRVARRRSAGPIFAPTRALQRSRCVRPIARR